ncbi:MAG: MFS transporter [Egibacteraceae bacterium]
MSGRTPAAPRRGVAAGASAAAALVAALDAYVVVTLLVPIVGDLGVPLNHLERATPVITGYLLGYVAAMPLLGGLSDRLGRRPIIQASLAAFAVGSAVSAAAPSLAILVAGRVVQGAAGGALLPVTFALIGDLWDERDRPLPLGLVGGCQEAGSLLGPLYGAGLAAVAGWRGVFWINLPLAALAAVAIHRSVPARAGPVAARAPIHPLGGLLSTASLAAIIAGLYNPDPAAAALAPWGPWALGAGCGGLALFALWERRSPGPLLDLTGVDGRLFATSLGVSFLSGVALMSMLVNVPLVAQTLLGLDTLRAALVLSRFLVALPVGAVLGALLVRRLGERAVTVTGLACASVAYWLLAGWPPNVLEARHVIGAVSLPRMDVDLALAGLGLGLVIAPLAVAALRATGASQHGAASAAVVLARTMGMLVGIAALAAWGLHRFQRLTSDLVPPLPFGVDPAVFAGQLRVYEDAVAAALRIEYREIFLITAGVCLVAALLAARLPRAVTRRAPRTRETGTPARSR